MYSFFKQLSIIYNFLYTQSTALKFNSAIKRIIQLEIQFQKLSPINGNVFVFLCSPLYYPQIFNTLRITLKFGSARKGITQLKTFSHKLRSTDSNVSNFFAQFSL